MSDNIPIHSTDYSLPFNSYSVNSRDFEELCAELFELEFGIRFGKYGRSGDKQRGIDLISESQRDSGYIAVQCKKVKSFGPSDLLREIGKITELPFPVSALYFAVSCDVSSQVRDLCLRLPKTARTASGEIGAIHIWDGERLSRLIRKYPRLVGSYFGLQWRDHLFPHLKKEETNERLGEITQKVDDVKRLLEIQVSAKADSITEGQEASREFRLSPLLEGYFRSADGVATFHGDCPSEKGLSLKYEALMTDQAPSPDAMAESSGRVMFAMVLSPEEAIDLECVLLMDKNQKASRSTYYCRDVVLTHIDGPAPMISIPSRDMSFMFARDSDYLHLLGMVERYLDNSDDADLSARRERTLRGIFNARRHRALVFGLKYD
jgi:hypothetical protein